MMGRHRSLFGQIDLTVLVVCKFLGLNLNDINSLFLKIILLRMGYDYRIEWSTLSGQREIVFKHFCL